MDDLEDLSNQFHDSATVLPRAAVPGTAVPVPGAASHPSAWEESSGRMSPVPLPSPVREMVEEEPLAPTPVASGHRVVPGRAPSRAPRPPKGSLVPLTESGSVTVPRDALLKSRLGPESGPPLLKRAHTLTGELDSRFGQSSFVIVTTEASHGDHFHWFRWPSLRQEWLDEDKKVLRRDRKDRKANLMELYYDLIFVAVIGLLGHSIRLQSALSHLAGNALLPRPLRQRRRRVALADLTDHGGRGRHGNDRSGGAIRVGAPQRGVVGLRRFLYLGPHGH